MSSVNTVGGDGRWPWWKRGLVIVGIWSIPATSSFVSVLMERPEDAGPLWQVALQVGYIWVVFAALTPAVMTFQRWVPAGRRFARHWIPAHLGFGVLFAAMAIAIAVPAGFLIDGFGEPEAGPATLGERFARAAPMLVWGSFFYWLILAVVCAADGVRRTRQQERRATALERSLAAARMEALRSQLHPHFLFNTLNSISSLVRQNRNSSAVEMIGGLSELARPIPKIFMRLPSDRCRTLPVAA